MAMVYVGTIGEELWRSDDLGRTWSPEPGVPGDARIYALAVSPDGQRLYAGAEGGIYRHDGAKWSLLELPDASLQVWSLGIHPREPSMLLAGCRPLVLLCSEDEGKHWTFYAGLGNGPPGTRGTVLVSTDNGRSWRQTGFPGAGSSIWSLGTDPSEPELLVAAAIKGELFTSRDGGRSWIRAPRKFAEVRAVACAA